MTIYKIFSSNHNHFSFWELTNYLLKSTEAVSGIKTRKIFNFCGQNIKKYIATSDDKTVNQFENTIKNSRFERDVLPIISHVTVEYTT